jgi:hypothetical protein
MYLGYVINNRGRSTGRMKENKEGTSCYLRIITKDESILCIILSATKYRVESWTVSEVIQRKLLVTEMGSWRKCVRKAFQDKSAMT